MLVDIVATFITYSAHLIRSAPMSALEDFRISRTSSTSTSGALEVNFLFLTLNVVDEVEAT